MTLAILFWVLMIVGLIFGAWNGYSAGQPFNFKVGGQSFLLFILLALLGWKTFGPPVAG